MLVSNHNHTPHYLEQIAQLGLVLPLPLNLIIVRGSPLSHILLSIDIRGDLR